MTHSTDNGRAELTCVTQCTLSCSCVICALWGGGGGRGGGAGGGGGGQDGQLSLRQFNLFVFFVLTGSTLQTGTGLRDSFRLSWTLQSWKGRLPCNPVVTLFLSSNGYVCPWSVLWFGMCSS